MNDFLWTSHVYWSPQDAGGGVPADASTDATAGSDAGGTDGSADEGVGSAADADGDGFFQGMGGDYDADSGLDEVVVPPASSSPAEPPQQSAGEAPAAPTTTPPSAPEQPAPPAAETPEAPAEEPPQIEALAPSESQDPLQVLMDQGDAVAASLATRLYQLDDATIDEIQTNAETAIPKLLGRVHVQATITAMQQFRQEMPRIIQQMVPQLLEGQRMMEGFAAEYPALASSQQGLTLLQQTLPAFAQSMPKASRKQVLDFAARAVMGSLGLQNPPAQTTPAQSSNNAAPAPAAPKIAPFVPADSGADPGSPATPQAVSFADDIFAGMGADYD